MNLATQLICQSHQFLHMAKRKADRRQALHERKGVRWINKIIFNGIHILIWVIPERD